ncbi:membrane protein [Azorhizobium oxalatiphilum]|uniref:Membrane protein n=1 Tax=Azorhizobium oxalatiphilum TaxID=980631 RepID=A0A917CFG9_9HYPH|nr:DUF2244 domain-containing protein [Azorhizobium oxalatiphilum]GGF84941.1 membrane protein [Azorhizobium oxalatiphilum]
MTDANDPPVVPDEEPTVFAATLAPHRSLSKRGFVLVILLTGGISFVSGGVFLAMGAWPVFGFFGLDVLLVYWAFKSNFRAADAREYIRITPSLVEVRHVPVRGKPWQVRMNPFWTRVKREDDEDHGTLALALVSRGRETPVGGFLGPAQKGELADGLAAALSEVKRGVTRTTFG